MVVERTFVTEGIKRSYIEEFLAHEFAKAGYSHCEIQRTPLSTRIVVFVDKPGLVIGRGGRNIDIITDLLKQRFKLENPQLDVREVERSELDAMIVAKQISAALQRGLNYKRVANIALQRVMDAGAVGVGIRIGGKLGGDKSRFEKFSAGYLKHSGETAETLVKNGRATSEVKAGTIGIQVRIMTELPKEIVASKRIKEIEEGESGDNKKETTP